ncbi:hypothetical protein QJS10_CPB21g01497 [Acorus calamus]|uniref:PLAC8 family protein n=1 Tax=Acorus calamus TaxID=4465 RepID=A0AAV9C6P5_ACOCL|nr:hypothetical protein QJS10_CPB21g01497 [Acorus calamus]
MVLTDNTATPTEIHEELEMTKTENGLRLIDFIPIDIPTIQIELIEQKKHHDKRFLDFLRARPFRKLIPVFRKSESNTDSPSTSTSPPTSTNRRRHFRVPFVRKINWPYLKNYCMEWIKNPVNVALLFWLACVAVSLIILFLVMTGILDGAIPKKSRRKKWIEIDNQILNALFTLMCIYQHPKLFHQAVLLVRWTPNDASELRKSFCKNGVRRPHDRFHIWLVVVLLHITCLAQYVLCGLYWGYNRKDRPDVAENLCIGVGIAAPVIAGIYTVYSPLGRKPTEEESRAHARADEEASSLPKQRRGEPVSRPEWAGGLFDVRDDSTVFWLSCLCTWGVFGWNMERLGFGNMYVHIVTFVLLCLAPFWVFNIAALNIHDDVVKPAIAITGIVLAVFGLFYGGFWRIQMRKRFGLPGNGWCCGRPAVTDCFKWLFCWPCALAQEVRTGNLYDVEEGSLYVKGGGGGGSGSSDGEGSEAALHPLPREGLVGEAEEGGDVWMRSRSCPAEVGGIEGGFGAEEVGVIVKASSMRGVGEVVAMTPPVPALIVLDDLKPDN